MNYEFLSLYKTYNFIHPSIIIYNIYKVSYKISDGLELSSFTWICPNSI